MLDIEVPADGPVKINGVVYVPERPTRGYGPIPDTVIRWRVADPEKRLRGGDTLAMWVYSDGTTIGPFGVHHHADKLVREVEADCGSAVLYIGEVVE